MGSGCVPPAATRSGMTESRRDRFPPSFVIPERTPDLIRGTHPEPTARRAAWTARRLPGTLVG